LKERYGKKYTHLAGLGNVNHNDPTLPFVLVDPQKPIERIVLALEQGANLLLLCACRCYEKCHSSLIFELVMQALQERGNTVLCEYHNHTVEANELKRLTIHDDGKNIPALANYCEECIRGLNNDYLESMNDIATQDDYQTLWN
jgi:hypothetical protein